MWLEDLASAAKPHLQNEESVLFPMMRQGPRPETGKPVGAVRHEHEMLGDMLWTVVTLCNNFEPPPEACDRWRALYVNLAKFTDDQMMHMHLENNVLFPRFAT